MSKIKSLTSKVSNRVKRLTSHRNKMNALARKAQKLKLKGENLRLKAQNARVKAEIKNFKQQPKLQQKKMEFDYKNRITKNHKDVLMAKYKHQWKNSLAVSLGSSENIKALKDDDQNDLAVLLGEKI